MKYKDLYISCTEDCEENEGGYFCQVYTDESLDDEIDYFCIHTDELETNTIEDNIRLYIDNNPSLLTNRVFITRVEYQGWEDYDTNSCDILGVYNNFDSAKEALKRAYENEKFNYEQQEQELLCDEFDFKSFILEATNGNTYGIIEDFKIEGNK